MNYNNNWPFADGGQVIGMKLPKYLAWAAGDRDCEKELLLPSIQRGFVWKPKQIVDLWDSLLRGMPIGSLMLSKLSEGLTAGIIATKETKHVSHEAMGLLDGQQRTLAMMIGWPSIRSSENCLWIDLAEEGHAGSPFEIRLTTKAQPFGFQRISQSRLSRHERREARKKYDEDHPEFESMADYELFSLDAEHQPRPWKANSEPSRFIKVTELWEAFKITANDESAFKATFESSHEDERICSLHNAFLRLESLEVPLILIPEYIGTDVVPDGAPSPLVLLFERIGRNGAALSSDDLLFSMIKQQWPEAQELVNKIHDKISVRAFMSATDYVMSAFRLAAAQCRDQGEKIADNPRPNPNDFHRHLGSLLGKKEESNKPLREYLEKNSLASAYKSLYSLLAYRKERDIGLPSFMMPHLPRGLIQVLLRWVMINSDASEESREKIVSFSLFWYLNVLHEDKASKKAFEIISSNKDTFPAKELYDALIESPSTEEFGLALPLMSDSELEEILSQDSSAFLRSHDDIFKKGISTLKQRDLYKRFCWGRKPILLWLQRDYVNQKFETQSREAFAGLTDEDTVPYDYDHLCPRDHWGADWRNITKIPDESSPVMIVFKNKRNEVGNCIGNLHVLESSLNRSFGNDPLTSKIKSKEWNHKDSLLYHYTGHEKWWDDASPIVENEANNRMWDEMRLQAFQDAVYGRAKGLYFQFYKACKHVLEECP